MNALPTAFRAYVALFPILLLVSVLISVAEVYLGGSSGIIGGKIVMHVLVIYLAHLTILDGRTHLLKKHPTAAAPKFGFYMMIVGIVFVPLILGVFLGLVLMGAPVSEDKVLLSLVVGILLSWISLIFFGQKIPAALWRDLGGEEAERTSSSRGYAAFYLFLWNVCWATPTFVAVFLVPYPVSKIGQMAYEAGFGMWSLVATCLTAAVLSHAFLRGHNYPAQGLIKRL